MNRILKLTPVFLGGELCDCVTAKEGYTIDMQEVEKLYKLPLIVNAWESRNFSDLLKRNPFTIENRFTIFNTYLDYIEEPFIQEGSAKNFKLVIENNLFIQQWLNIHWHLPEGWEITPALSVSASLEQFHCNIGRTAFNFTITPIELKQSRYNLILEITSVGCYTKVFIPVVLIAKG